MASRDASSLAETEKFFPAGSSRPLTPGREKKEETAGRFPLPFLMLLGENGIRLFFPGGGPAQKMPGRAPVSRSGKEIRIKLPIPAGGDAVGEKP